MCFMPSNAFPSKASIIPAGIIVPGAANLSMLSAILAHFAPVANTIPGFIIKPAATAASNACLFSLKNTSQRFSKIHNSLFAPIILGCSSRVT